MALRRASGRVALAYDEARAARLAYDEARAARAITHAVALASARRRITRMYVYQWRAGVTDRFDAGLVRPDRTVRSSYAALARGVAALGAPVPAAAPAATLRWRAGWSRRRPPRLVVRARCRPAAGRCTGRVRISVRLGSRTRQLAQRDHRTGARGRWTVRLRVRAGLRRRIRRAARRRVLLRIAPVRPAGAPAGIVRRLPRPPR